jgi:hypothetical protein
MAFFRTARFALTRSWGMVLLGIWLILWGVMPFLKDFPHSSLVLAVLAIVAGILILFQR